MNHFRRPGPAFPLKRISHAQSRSIAIRLIGCHPTLDRLFGTWGTIESVAFT